MDAHHIFESIKFFSFPTKLEDLFAFSYQPNYDSTVDGELSEGYIKPAVWYEHLCLRSSSSYGLRSLVAMVCALLPSYGLRSPISYGLRSPTSYGVRSPTSYGLRSPTSPTPMPPSTASDLGVHRACLRAVWTK